MEQLWRANIEGFYTTSPLHVIARALMRSSWFQCLDTEGHTSGDRVILISENWEVPKTMGIPFVFFCNGEKDSTSIWQQRILEGNRRTEHVHYAVLFREGKKGQETYRPMAWISRKRFSVKDKEGKIECSIARIFIRRCRSRRLILRKIFYVLGANSWHSRIVDTAKVIRLNQTYNHHRCNEGWVY